MSNARPVTPPPPAITSSPSFSQPPSPLPPYRMTITTTTTITTNPLLPQINQTSPPSISSSISILPLAQLLTPPPSQPFPSFFLPFPLSYFPPPSSSTSLSPGNNRIVFSKENKIGERENCYGIRVSNIPCHIET